MRISQSDAMSESHEVMVVISNDGLPSICLHTKQSLDQTLPLRTTDP
jgi:hypothetical protein